MYFASFYNRFEKFYVHKNNDDIRGQVCVSKGMHEDRLAMNNDE